MKLGHSLTISSLTLLLAGALPGGCGTDGLVGGACDNGLSNCSNRCVNLQTDRNNCGRCGNRCDADVDCIRGICGGGGEGGWGGDNPNGGSGNYGRDGGGGFEFVDGGGRAGAFNEFDVLYPGDGSNGGNGGGSSAGGSTGDGGELCVPPYNTAAQCGSCHTVCVEPTRVCAPVEGSYSCVPFCDPPLIECAGACVDLQSDSDNCGQCGRACRSAICQGGTCIDAQSGYIIAMCMNYREINPAWTTNTLLGNAIFQARVNPVKILAYDEFVDSNVRARVDTAIGWASATQGWTYRMTSARLPEDVNAQLKKPDFDVFLVYDQPLAPTGTLSSYGSQWAQTIESFSHVGGVVVVMSGATGTKEMGALLTSSRMLEVTRETAINQTMVYNNGMGIGAGVASTFLAPYDTCVFATPTPSDSTTFFVVTDDGTNAAGRRPVVIQRIASPTVE